MSNRTIRTLLFLSLAVNVFAAGYLVSEQNHRRPHARFEGFSRMTSGLDEETKGEVKAIIEAHKPQFQSQAEKLRTAREAVDAALKAEPYSRARAETAFAKLRKEIGAMQKNAQSMTLDIYEKLPAEKRDEFIERLPHKRWEKRDKGRSPKPQRD